MNSLQENHIFVKIKHLFEKKFKGGRKLKLLILFCLQIFLIE